jgi:hypothetical protein
MNSSLPRCFLSSLTFAFLLAAGGCSTRSTIGQQTGQGGSSTGGTPGSGTGGQANQGDGGSTGTGGIFNPTGTGGSPNTGTGGSPNTGAGGSTVADGGSCPTSAGNAGSSGGSLSFGTAVESLTHAGSFLVALGDLNGDGEPDLAVGNYTVPPSTGGAGGAGGAGTGGSATGGSTGTGGTPGTTLGSVSVFLSATGGYGTPQLYSGGFNLQSIAAGELNGDGKTDLAIVNGQGVSVFFNSGSGTLLPPVSFATGTGPAWVAVGDLNGDGQADLAVANRGASNGTDMVGGDVAVLLNMGGGTFVAANYPAGASPISVTMADLNDDGKADLAVASGTGVSVLLNNGNGTFGAPASYGSGTNPVSVAAGDLNGDGKIDLAVAGNGGGASVLLNIGNGTFAAAVNYIYPAASYGSGPVVIGDLNGDGRPDLAAVTHSDGCSAVGVLLNQGSGVFGMPSYVSLANPYAVTLGDLNGDGQLDLVVPNGDGVAVLLNTIAP